MKINHVLPLGSKDRTQSNGANPAIYKTTVVIISHFELCGRAQVSKTLQR